MPEEKTLRDEFALAAMAGDLCSHLGHLEDEESDELRYRARIYYRMADAMILERQVDRGRVHPFRRKDDPNPPPAT